MQQEAQPQSDTRLPIIDPGMADSARGLNPAPTSSLDPPIAQSELVSKPPALVDGKKRTWGENLFNQGVYGWGMFGANLFLSAGITYWSKHNNTGKKAYSSLQSFYRKIGFKNEYLITSLTNAFTLLMGGHIVALGLVKPQKMQNRRSCAILIHGITAKMPRIIPSQSSS